MAFKITILGTSSALPTSKRNPSAHALNIHERFFLIDCGEGTQMQLRKFRVKFSKIDNIFISHLHGDHFFGLFGLISSYNLLGRNKPLNIFAHKDLKKMFVGKSAVINKSELNFDINFYDLPSDTKKIIYEDKNIIVESFPMIHRIPSNGFIFREKIKPANIKKQAIKKYDLSIEQILQIKDGKDFVDENGNIIPNIELTTPPKIPLSYAYMSDTAFCPQCIDWIKGVDILYHEATFAEDKSKEAEITFHSTAKQAATVAKQACVKKLIIGHFSARYKNTTVFVDEATSIFSNTIAASEGDEFTINEYKPDNWNDFYKIMSLKSI